MKRWFLAAAVLVGAVVGITRADYVIVIANIGTSKERPLEGDPNNPMPDVGERSPEGMIGRGIGFGRPGFGRGEPGAPGPGYENPELMGPIESVYLVTTVIEVKQLPNVQFLQQAKIPIELQHPWGRSVFQVTNDIRLVPWTTADGRPMPTLSLRFQARQNEALRGGKPSVDKLLELAEWALGHGLLKECADTMKKAAEADREHPAVVAFRQVEADLARPVTQGDAAEVWRKKLLENYKITRSAHYALLHTALSDDAPEVRNRLTRLENTMRGFYYWFALKGRRALPVPEHRLVVVLVNREDAFRDQHRIFGNPTLVGDGFYVPRDNIVVFSTVSLDAGYQALLNSGRELWTKFDRNQLLTNPQRVKPVTSLTDDPQQLLVQALEASTKAVILKAMEVDAERATVSHLSTRQLLAASGLLPCNVAAPEWLRFGLGSFFESSKGSPWSGVGTPSASFSEEHNYLYQYKKMTNQDRKLDKAALLRGVVTDQFFRQAPVAKDPQALVRARATAWALTYFLAHKKLDDLFGYFQELSRLPRDLEFDEEVLLTVFARAFKLTDAKGKPDAAKLGQFANEWHEYINLTPLEVEDVLKLVHKTQNEMKAPSTPGTPGAPGTPGILGAPGAPVRP
ncbi:MAG TPA: DUF1570 domain-containing protein [Gemmataceae bacterium]|nr:DUF1570 domain-containing protein [Gemmataceae bacterium]